MRASGILLPISSLPSSYGIGAFNKAAYRFVDQLEKAGQKYWQILPLGTTGYGDSPYQSFSAYAGNPYFIDIDDLKEKGLLTKEECEKIDFSENTEYVNYDKLYRTRFELLRKAFQRFHREEQEYLDFTNDARHWLKDYALYMSIKNECGGLPWDKWEDKLRFREKETIEKSYIKYKEEIAFQEFQQFMFFQEWKKLKGYANRKGIQIIGDIPIYVAHDSADTWVHPELFILDENRTPIVVSGCPPDPFSETGQLWGNPIYDWDYHKKTNYVWWKERMRKSFQLYDVVRVDHFRGFDAFYQISYGEKTAEYGTWEKGPGVKLFQEIEKELGELNIIAEDLGFITESVQKMLKETGYPGMKILQFAFDSREEGDYNPLNYRENCVVYTGTHDNDTLVGWYHAISPVDRQLVRSYAKIEEEDDEKIAWKLISMAMSTRANLCVIPMQDYLGLGSKARMNTPSTLGENWKWRLTENEFTDALCKKIRELTREYQR